VSSGGLACEQENPEVRGGDGIANQFGSIVLSHDPRRPAAPIPRRSSEQDHNTSGKLVNPLIEPLRIPSPEHRRRGKSQPPSPRITVRNTSPVILHPVQSPGKLLRLSRTGTSSPSSTSHHRSYLPREFTFHPLSSTTKATPRFALTH
jgi:hypothetical protein